MNTERSDILFRPALLVFILTLLMIFSLQLLTGCVSKNIFPAEKTIHISQRDAAKAGSMALYMQGLLYENSDSNSTEQAVDAYRNALKLDPLNTNAVKALVRLLLLQQQFEQAYATLDNHLTDNSCDSQIQYLASCIAGQIEQPLAAAQWASRALKNDSTNAVFARSAIIHYFGAGEDKDALRVMDHFTESLTASNALKFAVELSLAATSSDFKVSPAQAVKCGERAFKFTATEGQRYDLLRHMSWLHLEAAQTNQAIYVLEEAYDLKPDNCLPLFRLGMIYKDSPSLMRKLEKRVKRGGKKALRDQLSLGFAYHAQERLDEAVGLLESYHQQRLCNGLKLHKSFYISLGMMYEQLSDYAKLDLLLTEALRSYPDDAQLLNFSAFSWAVRSVNLDQALCYINIALRQEPENPAYIDTKGWVLHKLGRSYEALQLLLKACTLDNQEPEILDHTGDVLYAVGNEIIALDFWKTSYLLNPQPAVAEKLRALGEEPPQINSDISSK